MSWDGIFVVLLCRGTDKESYSVEFVFDADVKCAVTVHYKATEDLSTGLAMWVNCAMLYQGELHSSLIFCLYWTVL